MPPLYLWCQKSFQQDCGYGIVTTDPRICGNMAFWGNKTCALHSEPGLKRCNGDFPGQCAGHLRFLSLDLECSDGSDQLTPLQDVGDCGEKLKCRPRQSLQVQGEIVSVTDEVCLDDKLICDLHPQCRGGEDELRQECDEIYLRKKIFFKRSDLHLPKPLPRGHPANW